MAYLNDVILGAYKRITEVLGYIRVAIVDVDGYIINQTQYKTEFVDKASATLTYVCKQAPSGAYLIQKIDSASGVQITYATIKNNSTVLNYADAKTDRATLTYGLPEEAF